ncbi:helix-turn-helix domain-containing protein [Ruminococcus flavefaciens]|uniref:helix-turn-helix domain-containing protein n=1 Tax=Ruminococcus flavefaciens TaxID=1265 RepID=UPI0026F2CB41|nr:helix-turn-helix transcriptional regulator [Ruminococcus flavefaciens]
MELNYILIGIQIQKHREKKGLTQAELGEIIDSTERHVRRIEGGHCGVSLNLLVSIANALNASIDDILSNNLSHTSSSIEAQIHDILIDCNNTETAIIIDMLKHLKALLSKYDI